MRGFEVVTQNFLWENLLYTLLLKLGYIQLQCSVFQMLSSETFHQSLACGGQRTDITGTELMAGHTKCPPHGSWNA